MPQEASNVGDGNTIVQIVGDGNIVTAGHPHLRLTRYVARRQIRQDQDRLSSYTRSTPLLGREVELASLHAYLGAPRPLLVRMLIGGGGSGKTRLALELCEQASATSWDTGFVTRTELHRFFDHQNLSAWGWRKPTLIVVDYAAEHAQLLGQWLDELADRAAPPIQPLRMLLLERNASTDTGWRTTVFASGGWHLFISVLAYHFVHMLRLQLKAKGIDDSWQTLRDTLATQQRVTVTMQRRDGRTVHVRKASRPEPQHQKINAILGHAPNPGGTHRALV